MPCERYEEILIDVALGVAPAPGVAAHLEGCARCQTRLTEERALLATLDGVLRSKLDLAPSPELLARVRERVAAKASPRRPVLVWWLPLAAAAGLVAAAQAVVDWAYERPLPVVRGTAAPARSVNAPEEPPPAVVPQAAVPSVELPSPASRGAPGGVPSPPRRAHAGDAGPAPALVEVIVRPMTDAALSRFVESLQAELESSPGLARIRHETDPSVLEPARTEIRPLEVGPITPYVDLDETRSGS